MQNDQISVQPSGPGKKGFWIKLKKWPWRTTAGCTATVLILGVFCLHLLNSKKCSGNDPFIPPNVWILFGCQSLADIGQWASGVAGTLAFLWLILGYMQQSDELKLQRRELKLQRKQTKRLANETERQAKAIEATEMNARRDLFSRLLDQGYLELDSIAANILRACAIQNHQQIWLTARTQRDTYKDSFLDGLIELFSQFNIGSEEEKARTCLKVLEGGKRVEEFWRYIDLIESLSDEALKADPNGTLQRQFQQGRAYAVYLAFPALIALRPRQ